MDSFGRKMLHNACRLVAFALAFAIPVAASAEAIPRGAAARNIKAVGYSDLQGRPGFKMSIRQVGGRWYLYMGHLWHRGWSIVDVTNPTKPEVVKFIAGPDNTWTIQMEVSGDRMITALEKIAPEWGGDPSRPNDEGVLIWDISDPVDPKKLGQYKTGGTGTHRNFYAGGKYMHLAAGMPGYKGNIYVIVDIGDPANPVEAGRWWVPGQKEGEAAAAPQSTSLHGPPEVVGNTVFLPYGGAGMVILDINDVSKPKEIGRLSYSPPFLSSIGVHTVVPAPEKKDRLRELRSHLRRLQGSAQSRIHRRHFRLGQAAADLLATAPGSAGHLEDQKLLRA